MASLSLLIEAFTFDKALSIKITTLHFKLVFVFRQIENTIHFDFLAAIDENCLSFKKSLVKREQLVLFDWICFLETFSLLRDLLGTNFKLTNLFLFGFKPIFQFFNFLLYD